jgi:hypothetical protein
MATRSKSPQDTRWSGRVTQESNAPGLEEGVFTRADPEKIARPPEKPAESSTRRKAPPFRSAITMLVFYMNRAGRKPDKGELGISEQAEEELRPLYGKSKHRSSSTRGGNYQETKSHNARIKEEECVSLISSKDFPKGMFPRLDHSYLSCRLKNTRLVLFASKRIFPFPRIAMPPSGRFPLKAPRR